MFFSIVKVNSWSNFQKSCFSNQRRRQSRRMPVGQHISTVQSLQNLKCLHGQHHTPSACELGHVRHPPDVLALSATQSHAAAAHSSHTGHCQPPSECWETHFIIIYKQKHEGMQVSSAFTLVLSECRIYL